MMIMQVVNSISPHVQDYLLGIVCGLVSFGGVAALVVFTLDRGLFKDIRGNFQRFREVKNEMSPEAQRAASMAKSAAVGLIIFLVTGNMLTVTHPELSKAALIGLELLPGLPLALLIYWTMANYRFGDELQKRVMMEGALVAVPFSVVALFIVGIVLSVDPELATAAETVYSVPVLGWALGMAIAWKRHTGSALGIPSES